MKRLHKVEQIGLICSFLLISSESLGQTQPKPWLLMADGQYRDADVISHAGGVTGSFGRSRFGAELIYQTDDRAIDLEWYRYQHDFTGAVAGTDRSYGNTQDLMLSGFRQWKLNDKYAGQVIYGLELAAEESVGLSDGFRWGLGGALRWQPDDETDVALGLMLQDRVRAVTPKSNSGRRACRTGSSSGASPRVTVRRRWTSRSRTRPSTSASPTPLMAAGP